MLPSEPQGNTHIHILKASASFWGQQITDSFLSFRCPASRRVCLPFAAVRNYVAEHPCFYSGVVSLPRHKHEGRNSPTHWSILEPQSQGRAALWVMQIRAIAQFQDFQTEKSWCSTNTTRAWHAFLGQGDPGSPTRGW